MSVTTTAEMPGVPNAIPDSTLKQRYWNQFTQLKENCIYFDEYIENLEWWEKWKNRLLAFGSSSAIAGWVIWKEYPFIWGGIIMLTQIIQAISPHILFKQVSKNLQKLSNELDLLCINIEDDWYKISNDMVDNNEVHSLYIKHKKSISKIMDTNSKEYIHQKNKTISRKASSLSQIYFHNHYSQEKTND